LDFQIGDTPLVSTSEHQVGDRQFSNSWSLPRRSEKKEAMHLKQRERFVLLIDYDCEEARRTAIDLVGSEGHLLVANKAESAFEFAKQHQPAHIVIPQSRTNVDGRFLPEVLLEFSPQAEIVLVCDDVIPASSLALGQGAGL
jgi:hypothetical protein